MKAIKVLVVDDSAVVRGFLKKIIENDSELELVGVASHAFEAREMLIQHNPDVMILDIEMPKIDGISFLTKVMTHKPTRTIIFSSLTTANSPMVMRAYEAGALGVIGKPSLGDSRGLTEISDVVLATIKQVSHAKFQANKRPVAQSSVQKTTSTPLESSTDKIVAIASSTGGTEALKVILPQFPADSPGIVIVQHMPPVFTSIFAAALDKLCHVEVREAKDGDRIIAGRALLAPGNYHMEVVRFGGYYQVKLHQEPLLHGVRPAADYLFKSLAKSAGKNAVGIILTGLGRDGAEGLNVLHRTGAWTIVQDEETSVVYGMPKAAFEIGAASEQLPLLEIPYQALRRLVT